MLIVKGENQKSVLANILMDKTNSICFQYGTYPVMYNSIYVDNNEFSLSNFIECIDIEFDFLSKNEEHHDYLIIYTNENEDDLFELIDWINKNRWKIRCCDVIVMCR